MADEDIKKWSLKQKFSIIGTFIGIIVGLVTIMTMVDDRYAKAADQEQVHQQTIQIIQQLREQIKTEGTQQKMWYKEAQKQQQIRHLEQRKWFLRDMMRRYPDDSSIIDEYKEIKEQLNLLKQIP